MTVPPVLLAELNDAQHQAVLHAGGPLLIVAGAGSGKTRVITRRIAALIARGVPAHRILAITFTNKAAREMADRVLKLVPGSRAWVSTFHAAAARMLRMGGEAIGVPRDFTIIDRDDLVTLARRLIKARHLDPKEVRPESVLEAISLWKNHGLTPAEAQVLPHEPSFRPGAPSPSAIAATIWPELAHELTESRRLDFDDLLLKCRDLVCDPAAGASWRDRFVHVLVDEYQDTNRLQSAIADALASGHGNLTVCGDPDQSIYAWRGADLTNLLDFSRRYPAAELVRLEKNYRSTGAILAIASALIAHNKQRIERGLESVLEQGELPRVITGWNEADEAEQVARAIFELVAHDGMKARDVAVLYRTNALSRPFEAALRARGIPYRVVGALEFYARREIKDLLAWLRLKVNPRDTESFLRAVNVPPRGIGEVTQVKLLAAARSAGLSLVDLLLDGERCPKFKGAAAKGAQQLIGVLKWLRAAPDRPVAALLQELVSLLGFERWLEEAFGAEGEDRVDNVRALLSDAHDFDESSADAGLARFLEERVLVQDADDASAEKSDAVALMTLHSAKGLEFRAVFIAGLEEDRLPHRRVENETDLEEERRLLYVGITRARERLWFTHAGQRFLFGRMEPAVPSRFLHEIPPALLQDGTDEGGMDGTTSERSEPSLEGSDSSFGRSDALLDRSDGLFGRSDTDPGAVQVVLDEDGEEVPSFSIGDRVTHEQFGPGQVVDTIGSGVRGRVRVRFRAGEKLLHLAYARLRKVRQHEP